MTFERYAELKKTISMAESSSETEIKSIKDALRAQQHLLQKLYTELEKEREASATATSEALSMILRLQGEKAAVKMEASQYQRIAEEKLSHAEESLASLEDVIHEKDIEIASLEFQVQAYRYKLIASDLPSECKLTEKEEMGVGKVERTKLGNPTRQYSYREQVEILDEQVKEISDSRECGEELSVQDIYEIPETDQNLKASEPKKTIQKKQGEEKSSKNKALKSRKKKGVECQNMEEIVVESLPFQQLSSRMERLERERNGAREEEVRMLRDIQQQLNYIQSEMRSLKEKKPSPPDNSMVDVLREGMLYFWM